MKAQRWQLQKGEVEDPERLRLVLNQVLLDVASRLEAVEALRGLTILDVAFDTGATVAPTSPPFSVAAGGVRVSCPFSPTGLVLLRLENLTVHSIDANANSVKWRFAAGPHSGDGALIIDFVTGLLINCSYRMRVGVTRA